MNLDSHADKEYTGLPVDPSEQKVAVVGRAASPPASIEDLKAKFAGKNDGAKSKSPKKVATRKPPSNVPRKPLSAYNLFFQLERENIINGEEDQNYTYENVARIAQIYYEQGKGDIPKRKHRKSHGKISFAELARTIANKWRALDDRFKFLFEERAAMEKTRHHKEIVAWVNSKIKPSVSDQDAMPLDQRMEMPVTGMYPTMAAPDFAPQMLEQPMPSQIEFVPLPTPLLPDDVDGTAGANAPLRHDHEFDNAGRSLFSGYSSVMPSHESDTSGGVMAGETQNAHLFRALSTQATNPLQNHMSGMSSTYLPFFQQQALEPNRFPMNRANSWGMPSTSYGSFHSMEQQNQRFVPDSEGTHPQPNQWEGFRPSHQQDVAGLRLGQPMWSVPNSASTDLYTPRSEPTSQSTGAVEETVDRDVKAFLRYLEDA